ncbi:Ent-copalyl diphosphate synthase 1, chloroplastic [Dichanthelium oligosanthes]|uniref:Ent-copalyl diphosphate synthase 1, chloroplastic n=1 Tax=Dichanthelium oligosanthes TaxID=888268 RepID=A0A1E5VLI4_9POAL|nr:Ent-copalyl diphosphate synthase 1, chloroplastic [Dichanthelium oligosanthes]
MEFPQQRRCSRRPSKALWRAHRRPVEGSGPGAGYQRINRRQSGAYNGLLIYQLLLTIFHHQAHGSDFEPHVEKIRAMLRSMDDGDISISAYDTAWVAMVPRMDGGKGPEFPAAVQWILNNQLPDGSWGDSELFSAYDRLINTLGCVVTLTKWSLEPEMCNKGLSFLNHNIWKLAEEDQESMPIGFEIAFPSLIEIAKSLRVEFPYDHQALQGIYASREIKMKRIPKEVMHRVPTTILHSIEGMPGLDWPKLLNLQSSDGSFLFSPAATSYALLKTGDRKCFNYIDRIVKKFNGGAPNVYPVDLFEHIWVVDRLERLGISRYFQQEIEQCMDYVNRYWTEEGICWARNSDVKDVDDTAMAFRLLRLHGYSVSPDVFKNFEKDGEFFGFAGQSTQAVTGMYNLNRASQISFPGEDVLHRAGTFSYEFLRHREAQETLSDKWIVSKDLPGEVKYTLDFPWYANLPRVEARDYLDQYGGDDDVWIGKTLYRMPLVNNNVYLELARMDFNYCQALHQLEWQNLQKWYTENGLVDFGVAQDLLRAYFLAAACIYEPSRATERLAWARVAILANTISTHLQNNLSFRESLECFLNCPDEKRDVSWLNTSGNDAILLKALVQLTDLLAQEAQPIHEGPDDIHKLLRSAWIEWIKEKTDVEDNVYNESSAMKGSCMVHDKQTYLLLAQIIEISAGRIGEAVSLINNKNGDRIIQLTRSMCDSLHHKMLLSQDPKKNGEIISRVDDEIKLYTQEFAQYLLRSDIFPELFLSLFPHNKVLLSVPFVSNIGKNCKE